VHGATLDAALFHVSDEAVDIVAHEIELVQVVLIGRVYGHLSRRQAEDEPPAAHIDVRELEDIAKECAIAFRILAVDDRVRTDDHGRLLIE